jgi:outer membrane receptor protein involved in Fe transport
MPGRPGISSDNSFCCEGFRILSAAFALAAGTVVGPTLAAEAPSTPPLEEIVVTASLRSTEAVNLPASTTVLDDSAIRSAGLQHLADLTSLVPNLNWSGGTSRPRYFQLRGIGELEQYQGAPNPSVGFLIDDIDFSGVGMPATSFDVQQVEVLRGPQGTRYGANALAGLIKIKTNDPVAEAGLGTELLAGSDGLVGAGLVTGGSLPSMGEQAGGAWRIAAQRARSDGFRDNIYLHRDDTNGRDESTLRGKLRLGLPGDWQADASAMYVSVDNGFDAFSPDNGLKTYSDQPGRDAQRSVGASLKLAGNVGAATLVSTTSYADSDIVYSFDGDWGNEPYWEPYVPYQYFSHYDRQRATLAQDLRLTSHGTARGEGFGWLAGAYALRFDEDTLQRDYFTDELLRPPLKSTYDALTFAGYGEIEWRVAGRVTANAGLRVENRGSDYADSDGSDFSPDDTMVGGHLSLSGGLGGESTWYATLARGFKAGGFNIGEFVPESLREFGPEYLWNLESGVHLRNAARTLEADVSVFYMWREDQQVSASFQLDPGDPLSYVFYTDNAARGRNYGLEAHATWRLRPSLTLGATLGLLGSEYLDYRYGDRNLDGREQAAAPPYQYSLSAEWDAGRGWTARADLAGSGSYYFDTSNDQKSRPYVLVNLRAGYAAERWSVYAWGRNVFDEEYAVRGFYFGLEPPDFANELYIQRGDPRLVGVTATWSTP